MTRDPFFLIGRKPRPTFTFADLFGKRVATINQTMADITAALRRGEFDVVQLFQPLAEKLIAAGTRGRAQASPYDLD